MEVFMQYFIIILSFLICVNFLQAKIRSPIEVEKLEAERSLTTKLLIKSGKFVEQPIVEKNVLKTPTSQEKERGYIIFVRNYLDRIFHNTVPVEGDKQEIKTFGSPGEYIPITFAIYPLKELKGVTVKLNSLEYNGSKIGKENIDIRVARHMPQRIRKTPAETIFKVIPWLLEKKDSIDLYAGEKTFWGNVVIGPTRQWWITIKIPEDAKPGKYKGNIEISSQSTKSFLVPVEIEVFPIKLVSPKGFNYWFWDDIDVNNDYHVNSLKEHGIYGYLISLNTPSIKGGSSVDFTSFDGEIEKWLKKGFNGSFMLMSTNIYLLGETNGRRVIESINNHVKEKWKGEIEVTYFGIDEPANSAERQKELMPLLKWLKSIPGVVTVETLNSPEMYKLFGEYTDICAGYGKWVDLDKSLISKGKRVNVNIWIEGCSPMHARLESGLYPWKNKYFAVKIWSFKACGGDPLNDLDDGDPDWCLTAPLQENTDDIIPSINYECLRKGIDDRRYTVTLEELINKAKGNTELSNLVDSAQRLLDNFASRIPLTRDLISGFCEKISSEEIEKFKFDVAQKIVELQKALEK
jgi:hypothetical protein